MFICFRGGLTVQEALEIAYADQENVRDIYITPPDPHVLTDEDSGDEIELDPNNFTGRQLRAEAELKCKNSDAEEIAESLALDRPLIESQCSNEVPLTYNFSNIRNMEWTDGDLVEQEKHFPVGDYSAFVLCELSACDLFELFFDDSVFDLLLEETRRYALFLNSPDPKVTKEELKCFIGILILSGYNELPGKKCYWDSGNDMKNAAVVNAMRRDRFIQIMRFIHCADNNKIDKKDKLWKLRPLLDKIQINFVKHFVPQRHIDYDESMIKYYGRHGCKQFIRGKPIRFGYKVWSMNTKEGYLVNFEVYQGKCIVDNSAHDTKFGKASAPFIRIVENLPEKKLPYQFYVDNLFSSVPLFEFFSQNGYACTGTFRDNRIPKNCPLKAKDQLKKQSRGTFDSIIAKDVGIIFVRWLDNSVVTVGSTLHGVHPINNVKRYFQAEKKIVSVARPNLIGQYNNYMGGTDQMDQNIGKYRISIRGKKWWWCIFTWLIDAAINNAWILYRKATNSHSDQLSFRREIAHTYIPPSLRCATESWRKTIYFKKQHFL
ncbi:transposase is4 [Holotrichia oblita]|uniref:Transposase is4 n=1 Tax=Holotrichia oblita TaxID=644536 RepID=A0ACB9SIV3_HOLOL|nr:transposase is4 [Holotrichia oblita]